MRFTFHPTMCPPEQYVPLAKAAESVGFTGLTFPDSICYPEVANTKYPYNEDGSRNFLDGTPFLEPFVAIPALAAVTEKLRFTTSVVKLPIRNPVLVAKQMSTIGVMFPERLALGVGLSPWIEDFEICGERWEGRGKRFEQMIEIIRGLMTGEFYSYDSEYYQIASCKINPVPAKPMPFLLGGHADVALKRAARIADGWIHAGGNSDELAAIIEKLNSFRRDFGTADRPFEIHATTADAFDPEKVKRMSEMGVTECIVGFRNTYKGSEDNMPLDQKIGMLHWYAENVIQKVNG